MKCMRVPDSRPWQEFWAHRVQGTHRSTLAKAGRAGRKGGGDDSPPGDEAREHAFKANTAYAQGLSCTRGCSPATSRGALPLEVLRMRRNYGCQARDIANKRYSQRAARSHQSTSAGSFGLVRPAWMKYTRSAVPQVGISQTRWTGTGGCCGRKRNPHDVKLILLHNH